MQTRGGPDSPDVVCESFPLPIHWEVKRAERLDLYEALEQARNDKPLCHYGVVAHRKNHKDWLITFRADDFLEMVFNYVKND